MEEASATFSLGIQFTVAAGMVLVMTIIHSVGLVSISRILRLKEDRLIEHAFDAKAIALLGSLGLMLFTLHICEIFLFAGFYLTVDVMDTMEEALFYSASAYATLGWTADFFPQDWRLIGAFESLIGFMLIGWSTAFMVATMTWLTDSRRTKAA